MTGYQDFEGSSGPGRHARSAGSGEGGGPQGSGSAPWSGGSAGYGGAVAGGPAAGAVNAGSMPAQNDPGGRQLSVPKAWLIGLAGLVLILAGVSVFSLVKLSSVQASLQRQVSSEKSALSAEQQQVSTDQQKVSTLQSTVDSQLVTGLASFAKYDYVCSTSNVPFGSRVVTAYYPCADKNPN
jgi:hypothetical protein